MKQPIGTIDARWIGKAFSQDADLALPVRPRFIPELVRIPIGQDGWLFAGGVSTEVIRGKSSRAILPKVLPLFDGRRTLDEIAEVNGEISVRTLHDIASLLFSRGLIEEGSPVPIPADNDLSSFLGRFIDVSRHNVNRQQALSRLAASSVAIFGSPELADPLSDQMRESGVGRVECGASVPAGAPCNLSILISTGAGETEKLLQAATAAAEKVFLLRLGSREAHIGPLFIDGVTSCMRCFFRLHPHPARAPEGPVAQYWVALSALHVFATLAKIGSGRFLRQFRVISIDESGEMSQETRLSVRTPGCPDCGISSSPLPQDDSRLFPWIYHSATSYPARDLLSPKDYQKHYSAANVKLASDPKPSLFAESASVLLPHPLPLGGSLPWTRELIVEPSNQLSVTEVATLLAWCVGESPDNGGRRRLLPTGGNLGSVDLWVVARQVDGLPRSAYHYDAGRHRLERICEPSEQQVQIALGGEGLSDCLIIGIGDVAKCSQKYLDFGYRLAFYDSGVAIAFLYSIAENLHLPLFEYRNFDDQKTANVLGIYPRSGFPAPTFVLGVGKRQGGNPLGHESAFSSETLTSSDYSADEILARMLECGALFPSDTDRQASARRLRTEPLVAAVNSLDSVILRRRSLREYAATPIHRTVLEQMMSATQDILWRRVENGGPPCFVKPVLGVSRGSAELPPGIYELSSDGALTRRSAFGPELMEDCLSQKALGECSVAMFAVGDLGLALVKRGPRGYREMLQHSGAAIGLASLVSTSHRVGSCIAGGVIPAGLNRAAGMDGFRECPLLGCMFGYSRSGE